MNPRRKLSHAKRFSFSVGVVAVASASLWAPGFVWAQGKNGKGVAAARPVALSAAAGLAMGLIGKGKVTLQSAWEQKLLGRDDLLQLLSRQQLNGVPQEQQSEVRLGLAKLLAGTLAQGEEGLEAVAQWPSPVRQSIADYYRSVRDERAVGLYQELIEELDAQVEKSGPVPDKWINPLAHLALFYAEIGKPLQAIRLWEQAQKYSRNPEWRADVFLLMGRAYTQAGDAEKAKAAYDQVPQYGQAWYWGLAIHDQALALIK